MSRAVVWLRRDFRLTDQPALSAATRECEQVLPVFVFDPEIVSRFEPGGKPSLAFFSALLSLQRELEQKGKTIFFLSGKAEEVIPRFVRDHQADSLYFNRDYEPDGLARDRKVTEKLEAMGARVFSFKDHVLFEPEEILNQSDEPYRVFTPYKNACFSRALISPFKIHPRVKVESLLDRGAGIGAGSGNSVLARIQEITTRGKTEIEGEIPDFGEAAALKRLKSFQEGALSKYSVSRNSLPDSQGTSRLSIDLRSGAISPRQIWISVQASSAPASQRSVFLSELLWRNFFMTVGYHFPHVFRENYNPKYNGVRWKNRESDFQAWCEGRTGYPVVDAGMRELVKTGFMHNRARMITAMFLTKDLLIDWRWGERFFRQHLMDADEAVNNGNWQWCASTGCDAQPYFRIFNPTTQGKKFDPEGVYIRRWVTELRDLDSKSIHQPEKSRLFVRGGYPSPIVDHAQARKECLSAYDIR